MCNSDIKPSVLPTVRIPLSAYQCIHVTISGKLQVQAVTSLHSPRTGRQNTIAPLG